MTLCLNQMTLKDEQWPLALRVEAFRPEREKLKKVIAVALAEDEKGTIEPKTIEAVQSAIDQLRIKFEKVVPQTDPDYVPAQQTIKAMAGLTKMLYSPKMEQIIAELEDYQGTTMGELLSFMQAFNLRFAPANSFRQRQIYLKVYAMFSEVVNGSLASATDAAASSTVKTVENAGSEAINGLKSAAVGFFKDMDWKHLTGSSTPPPPPAPSQR
jgi:Asp-tRNA(Asn)/Glu-tRNA(Gln) amidotransferase A subunit family amidase